MISGIALGTLLSVIEQSYMRIPRLLRRNWLLQLRMQIYGLNLLQYTRFIPPRQLANLLCQPSRKLWHFLQKPLPHHKVVALFVFAMIAHFRTVPVDGIIFHTAANFSAMATHTTYQQHCALNHAQRSFVMHVDHPITFPYLSYRRVIQKTTSSWPQSWWGCDIPFESKIQRAERKRSHCFTIPCVLRKLYHAFTL